MVFSSLFFILVFLVACYGAYYFARYKGYSGNTVLLVFSLIFYAWSGPALIFLLAGMTLVCFAGAKVISGFEEKTPRKVALWITVCACLLTLGIFKYTGFFLENFRMVFGVPSEIPEIILPLGISFYTFQLISYVVDVYRGQVAPQKNYFTLLLYAALFHQCVAGPIVRYSDVNRELAGRSIDQTEISQGISRFAVGLAKKALLANHCCALADKLAPLDGNFSGVTSSAVLLSAVFYMLYIYLDFSAYSDMAIGMGQMAGFHFKENFNYPYVANSVTDFWRRWHISLSSFFRDYVYIPLGGNRCSIGRQIFNLAAVWLLTGFWHGAGWNFILWGAYYLILLLIEKFVFKIGKEKPTGIKAVLRRAYLLIAVCFGWMLFRYESLSVFGQAIGAIFTNQFANAEIGSLLLNNIFFIIVAIIACTPVTPKLKKLLSGKKVFGYIAAVIPAVLLIFSILALVGDSYNPFLYFNF